MAAAAAAVAQIVKSVVRAFPFAREGKVAHRSGYQKRDPTRGSDCESSALTRVAGSKEHQHRKFCHIPLQQREQSTINKFARRSKAKGKTPVEDFPNDAVTSFRYNCRFVRALFGSGAI